MTKNFLIVFLMLMLFSLACKKNNSSTTDNIDFTKTFFVTSSFDTNSSSLVISIKLDPRIHAYAPSEKIGKPVRLEILSQNGWAAVGPPDIPSGDKKRIGDLGESVVLKNNVAIRQKLKKGIGTGKAILYLQLCSEKACDRPRSHEINFD